MKPIVGMSLDYDPDEAGDDSSRETGKEREQKKAMPLRCRPVYGWDGKNMIHRNRMSL